MKNYKIIMSFLLIMAFTLSFGQQFQNNYCDLDCMDQAFELTDSIAEEGDYQQAYDHFEAIYNHCTATYCNADGSFK